MLGYNKRERCETFDADGWYHTGDRVYRRENDPRLFYVGRTSELIKTAGANVSPLEVEAVIEEFAEVAQCIVVGIDDPSAAKSMRRRRRQKAAIDILPSRRVRAISCPVTKFPRAGRSRQVTRSPPCPAANSPKSTAYHADHGLLDCIQITNARRQ